MGVIWNRYSGRRYQRSSWCVVIAAMMIWSSGAVGQGKLSGPIKVGAISSLASGAAFPESAAAVRAYFDTINAEGGINGRRLELIIGDDQGDPDQARMVAQRLVERESVVANVGSASTMECSVNAEYYRSHNIVSIQGTGVDPACFGSPNISPVNAGPYVGLAVALQFASDVLKREQVCTILMGIPGMGPGYEEAIAAWKKQSGKTLRYHDPVYPPGAPTRTYIEKVRDAGCNAVVFLGLEPWVIDWIKTAQTLAVKDIDWIFLTPAYTSAVLSSVGAAGEGVYAMSEFTPWSSRSSDLREWRAAMKAGDVPLTSFSQGGYLAAKIFVDVLRKIPGEIDRESVTRALKALDRYDTPLIGTPYGFGESAKHSSNRAIIPMVLHNQQWRIAHYDWIVAPPF